MKVLGLRLAALLPAGAALLLAACGSTGSGLPSVTPQNFHITPKPDSTPIPVGTNGGSGAPSNACSAAQFGSPLQPKDAPSDVHAYTAPPAMQIDTGKLYQVTIKTAKGDIGLCLQPKLAPKTVNNFVVLARNHFYDGIKFHRVVAGFVIQGGDPTGSGQGGPGYQFADEPVQGDYVAGCVAMANAGPNTNGSQFFICTADDTKLPKQYNLFGLVSSGMDVVLKIAMGDVMSSVTVQEQS